MRAESESVRTIVRSHFCDSKVEQRIAEIATILILAIRELAMDDTLKPPAYSAEEAERLDAEDRLLDDTSEGIDWDDIIATTQPDFEAGRFAFNSVDYPTEEAAMAAMEAFREDIFKEVLREVAARNVGRVT
jgi:hypothetical protein